MEVAGYDTFIANKYHGNRSKVKVTEIVNNTLSSITRIFKIIEMSNLKKGE